MAICTRLTKRQQPCRANRSWWAGITALPDPQACHTHLTATERAAYDQRNQDHEDARVRYLASDPACWSWPLTENAPVAPDAIEAAIRAALPYAESAEDVATTRLLAWQAGRCAACGHHRSLVTDHDHKTGLVRGYLCSACNTQEGLSGKGDSPFVRYRQRPPAQILGVSIRYLDPYTGEYAEPEQPQPRRARWEDTATKGLL